MLRVKGTALTASDYPVCQVLVKLDNGDWKLANITNRTEPWLLDMWMLDINTKALKNGLHEVGAKSYDGSKYSDEAVVPFTVDNKAREPAVSLENNMGWALLGVLILCCAVAWVAYRAMNRKRNNVE